jgi:hypothetical protein
MGWMRGGWLLAAVGLCLMMVGRSEGAVEYPPAPMGHVLDDAGLFDRYPEQLVEISARLMELEEEHDLPVYIAIYGGLLRSGIKEQTEGLYAKWVGKDVDGVVVVWDSDTRQLEFGLPSAGYYDLGAEDGSATRLPDQRMRPVLSEVFANVKGIESKRAYVDRLSEILVARLDQMLREGERQGGVSAGRVVVATLLLGGVLAGIALCARRLVRGSGVESRRQCYFPDVLVGSRLGATSGGGRVAVIDYMSEDDGEEDE